MQTLGNLNGQVRHPRHFFRDKIELAANPQAP